MWNTVFVCMCFLVLFLLTNALACSICSMRNRYTIMILRVITWALSSIITRIGTLSRDSRGRTSFAVEFNTIRVYSSVVSNGTHRYARQSADLMMWNGISSMTGDLRNDSPDRRATFADGNEFTPYFDPRGRSSRNE
jgi:hypothetical protein